MDMLKQWNDAVAYIESTLCGELDLERLSSVACVTPDSFFRFFSYMTGMTVREYIRRRRLTLAAYELRGSAEKVIDIALKYGYESADSFSRAFAGQHGVTPTQARRPSSELKAYPPVSFHMMIKGAAKMNFRMLQRQKTVLYGLSRRFLGEAAGRFEQEHVMWAAQCDDFPRRIANGIPGVWYGIWDHGLYSIARDADDARQEELERIVLPAGTYAAFTTEYGGFAGDALPRLREQVFGACLADAGYRQTRDYEVEVYHLYPKGEKAKRHYELWIPVEKE